MWTELLSLVPQLLSFGPDPVPRHAGRPGLGEARGRTATWTGWSLGEPSGKDSDWSPGHAQLEGMRRH